MVALFVFVRPLYYTQSCLASIFYTAGVLLIQQDNHVGSALFACSIALGHLVAGILLAGLMVRSVLRHDREKTASLIRLAGAESWAFLKHRCGLCPAAHTAGL